MVRRPRREIAAVSVAAKVEFINGAVAADLRRVEVASFVSPRRMPQMADAEQVLAALPGRNGAHYVGLVLNRAGFDRAARHAGLGRAVSRCRRACRAGGAKNIRGVKPT
jgi:hypothetical protein